MANSVSQWPIQSRISHGEGAIQNRHTQGSWINLILSWLFQYLADELSVLAGQNVSSSQAVGLIVLCRCTACPTQLDTQAIESISQRRPSNFPVAFAHALNGTPLSLLCCAKPQELRCLRYRIRIHRHRKAFGQGQNAVFNPRMTAFHSRFFREPRKPQLLHCLCCRRCSKHVPLNRSVPQGKARRIHRETI